MDPSKVITFKDPNSDLWCARAGRLGRVFRARTEELARQYAEKYGKPKPPEAK